MEQSFTQAGIYLIQTFFGLYTIVLMLRFLMQVSRVDYYNPLSQGIVKITDPAIRPFRKVFPTVYGIDFATLAVALLVQLVAVMLIMTLIGQPFFHPLYIAWVMLGLFAIIFKIYFFALIISVIASFLAQGSAHPALTLVHQIIEPICAPARRILPPMGGMDFSIILVFVAIQLVNLLIIDNVRVMLGLGYGIILGV
jgi:YggT family protein